MAKCPACGKEVETTNKQWNLGKIHVKQYECRARDKTQKGELK
ncbi:MAG: hypothetical protein OEW95_01740 [Candidatus Bathyarchaeota archaeon]|nr:hypothetical protein [Candidatus Bathyarchaeota archaeon]